MTEKSIFYKYHQRNFENKLSPSFFNKHTLSYKPIAEDFRNQKSVKFLTVGYPKSGNVWLNSMIAECLEIDVKPSINCFVTFTHSNLNTAILFDQSILRGACLIRDCRDIIVSYYYYIKSEGFRVNASRNFSYRNIKDFYFDFFVNYLDKYVVNLEGLIDGYVEFGWPILRYESLVDEPNETLKILFDRWNINVTEKKISNAIKNSSLKSMRKGGGKQLIKTHKSHFRKGGYGQYRKELPTKVLKDISVRYKNYLEKWGYDI